MKEQILGFFGKFEDGFNKNVRIVLVKSFDDRIVASVYAARLKEEGIPCFISSSRITDVLPTGFSGMGLHVRETDVKMANRIIAKMDFLSQKEIEEDFREATLDDIEFQKALNQKNNKIDFWIIWILIFWTLFVLIVCYIFK